MFYGTTNGPVSDLARELLNMKQLKAMNADSDAGLADLRSTMSSNLQSVMDAKKAQDKMGMPGTSAPAPKSKEGWTPMPGNILDKSTGGGGSGGTSIADLKAQKQAEEDWANENPVKTGSGGEPEQTDEEDGFTPTSDSPSGSSGELAKGGPVKAGKKYIVGEGGKDEVYVQGDGDVYPLTERMGIIPKEDGSIIPNDKLRMMARRGLGRK